MKVNKKYIVIGAIVAVGAVYLYSKRKKKVVPKTGLVMPKFDPYAPDPVTGKCPDGYTLSSGFAGGFICNPPINLPKI